MFHGTVAIAPGGQPDGSLTVHLRSAAAPGLGFRLAPEQLADEIGEPGFHAPAARPTANLMRAIPAARPIRTSCPRRSCRSCAKRGLFRSAYRGRTLPCWAQRVRTAGGIPPPPRIGLNHDRRSRYHQGILRVRANCVNKPPRNRIRINGFAIHAPVHLSPGHNGPIRFLTIAGVQHARLLDRRGAHPRARHSTPLFIADGIGIP